MRKTIKQLEHEITILELKNKALEAKIDVLESEVRYHVEMEAGVDL